MERIEKEREYIRNNWFKDHVATVTEHGSVTFLDWSEPGTSFYSVRYIFSGSSLFITGDIGDAVFSLTRRATIDSFEGTNLSYLMRKLSCSSRDRWNFDDETAYQQLDEWLDESIHDLTDDSGEAIDDYHERIIQQCKDIHRDLRSAVFQYHNEAVYKHEVWRCYQEYDDTDAEEFEMISDFGRQLPNEFIAYLLGIQMANEQLKKAVTG